MLTGICAYCKKEFKAQRSTRRFCSSYCKSTSGFKEKAASMPPHTCITCGTVYQPQWPKQVKFCSRSCEVTYSHANHWSMKDRVCITCEKTFQSLRKDCKECEDCFKERTRASVLAASLKYFPNRKLGIGSGGGQHYDPSKGARQAPSDSTYRRRGLEAHGKECQHCGFTKYPEILVVHHIDMDRTNSNIENLAVLCPNCHAYLHRELKRRVWAGYDMSKNLCSTVFNEIRNAEVKSRNEAGNSYPTVGQSEPKASGDTSQGQRIPAEEELLSADTRPRNS